MEHRLELDCVFDFMNFLREQNDHTRALQVGKQLYSEYKSRGDDTDYINLMCLCIDFARVYCELKFISEAELLYEETILLMDNIYGDNAFIENNSVEILDVMARLFHSMADLFQREYSDIEHYKKAEDLYKKALDIRRLLAADFPKVFRFHMVDTCNNFSIFCRKIGAFDMAEKYLVEALENAKCLAEENPNRFDHYVASIYNNLANLYLQKYMNHRFADAVELYDEALRIWRRLAVLNPVVYEKEIARVYNNLANIYCEHQYYYDAENMYHNALRIYRKYLRQNSYSMLYEKGEVCLGLAILYEEIYCYNNAVTLYLESISVFQKISEITKKDYSNRIIEIRLMLDVVNEKRMRIKDREMELQYAVHISKRLLEKDAGIFDTGLGKNYFYLFGLYRDSGRNEEARRIQETMSRDAVFAYRRLSLADPENYGIKYANACCYLADILNGKDNETHHEAMDLYLEAIQAYRVIGDELNDASVMRYATACYEVGLYSLLQESYKMAEELLVEALSLYSRVKNIDSDARAVCMMMSCYHLGVLYEDIDQDAKADEYYARTLEIAASYKDVNPDCAEVYEKLKD